MQNVNEENEARALQAQRKRPYAVRVFAGILGIQGGLMLVGTFVTLVSSYSLNPPLVLSFSFLYLNMGIFWILLAWGLGTFKVWAYWVTLLVEMLLLSQGILGLVMPNLFLIDSQIVLAPILILYLLISRNARAAFFPKNSKPTISLPSKG